MPSVAISRGRRTGENATCVLLLRDRGFDVRLIEADEFGLGLMGDEKVVEVLQGVSAVIASAERYTAKVLENLPDLRVVARSGVGFDRVDLGAATANDVAITITPNANHESVAEHAMALIMALARSLVSGDGPMRRGEWPNSPRKQLRGSTLGVVGLGRIGKSLATRALAMKMRVVATELQPDQMFVKENGIQLLGLDALLESADYVSLHCPLSEDTRGLIDGAKLSVMKLTAYLVNTARGGLIVEADLAAALRSGVIAGAGLDVFEQEPPGKDNPLYELDNVILSPHVAGLDELSVEEMGNEAANNIIDLSQGRWPEGAVVNDDFRGKWRW